MKQMKQLKILLCALVALCSVSTASSQVVGLKWGVLGGLNVPDYSFRGEQVDVKNKVGWQVGMTASLKLAFLTLDPQLVYVHQKVELAVPNAFPGTIKCHSVDVPVMVGLPVFGPMRVFAGPVFTLMNKCDSDLPFADRRDFDVTNLRSTMSYAVGLEARFQKVRFDLRYNGQFQDKKDVAITERLIGKMRSKSVSLNVGYYF